jgi:hypothetical protein
MTGRRRALAWTVVLVSIVWAALSLYLILFQGVPDLPEPARTQYLLEAEQFRLRVIAAWLVETLLAATVLLVLFRAPGSRSTHEGSARNA